MYHEISATCSYCMSTSSTTLLLNIGKIFSQCSIDSTLWRRLFWPTLAKVIHGNKKKGNIINTPLKVTRNIYPYRNKSYNCAPPFSTSSVCLLQLSRTRRFLNVVRLLIDVTRTLPSYQPLHHLILEYRRTKANYYYVFPYVPVLYLDNRRVRKSTSTETHFQDLEMDI